MAPRLEVEPELAAEGRVRRRRKSVFSTILALLMVVFAGGLWMGYHFLSRRAGEVPLIRADEQPIKTAPEQPGGMQVPGQNMYILNKEGQNDTHVEQLLPPPEAPLPRPTPQSATANAAPATGATAPSVTAPAPGQANAQPNAAVPPPPAQPNSPASAPVTAAAPPAVVVPPHPVVPPTPAPPPPAAPAQTAVAVPPHPVAPPLPPSPPRPAHAAPARPETARLPPTTNKAGGDYRIQVGAVRSVAAAQQEWNRLKRAQPDLLGSLHADAVRLDLGERGIFYRIQVGPIADAAAGDRLCRELKRRNVGCLLVRK